MKLTNVAWELEIRRVSKSGRVLPFDDFSAGTGAAPTTGHRVRPGTYPKHAKLGAVGVSCPRPFLSLEA